MIKIDDSIYIETPVRRVFEFATSVENTVLWQSDVIASEQTSEGPVGKGATYRVTNRFLGQLLDAEGVVSEFIPDEICSFQFTSGPVSGESSYVFQSVNGGTRFTARGRLEIKIFKLAGFLLNRKARKQVRHDLEKLKRLLENERQ
jgi:hypothetical protein